MSGTECDAAHTTQVVEVEQVEVGSTQNTYTVHISTERFSRQTVSSPCGGVEGLWEHRQSAPDLEEAAGGGSRSGTHAKIPRCFDPFRTL